VHDSRHGESRSECGGLLGLPERQAGSELPAGKREQAPALHMPEFDLTLKPNRHCSSLTIAWMPEPGVDIPVALSCSVALCSSRCGLQMNSQSQDQTAGPRIPLDFRGKD